MKGENEPGENICISGNFILYNNLN